MLFDFFLLIFTLKLLAFLIKVLEDESHEPMFRHEAGEALAAIGDPVNKFGVAEILKKYSNDPVVEVAETCQLALEMILWRKSNGNIPRSQYDSIGLNFKFFFVTPRIFPDPAPPLDDENKTVDELMSILLNQENVFFFKFIFYKINF